MIMFFGELINIYFVFPASLFLATVRRTGPHDLDGGSDTEREVAMSVNGCRECEGIRDTAP